MYVKVVREIDGKLVSSFAPGKWTVEYIPGEWVEPVFKSSYLWIYEILSDSAQDRCSEFISTTQLWEIETEDARRPNYTKSLLSNCSLKSSYWEGYWRDSRGFHPMLAPCSLWAKRVKLVRLIAEKSFPAEEDEE